MMTILSRLNAPVDAKGLAVFRILFGLLMLISCIRFVINGWIESLYLEPTYFFTYYGFSWIKPWPGFGMYIHFVLMALSALGITLGFWYRLSCLLFFVLFTYVELIDKTPYLNHYYFVSIISFLLIFLPAHNVYSIDARQKPSSTIRWIPLWPYFILRLQIATVYIFAGIAKINSDWLLLAQPLRIWLSAKQHFPVLGPLFGETWFAYFMSWAGTAYDLLIVFLLAFPKTRFLAFVSVCIFHGLTALLFPIGIFPWVMIVSSSLFFDPSWPKKLLKRFLPKSTNSNSFQRTKTHPLPAYGIFFFSIFFMIQLIVPLRHVFYPGNVNWTEEGFRFSWRVMLIEKEGHVEYTVKGIETGRTRTVFPHETLSVFQYKMMSTQADMIQQYAHHLAKEYEQLMGEPVEVKAYAWCAFNGRGSREYIDPHVDLSREPISFGPKAWIRKYE